MTKSDGGNGIKLGFHGTRIDRLQFQFELSYEHLFIYVASARKYMIVKSNDRLSS